ncbi:MAG TPA: hypothetical protein VKE96_12385 [Vicinamibacterales bacterium]|nr:hypothetical protein [Vicinamibacterales bacterium]
MALVSYQLTLGASPKQLSDVYGVGTKPCSEPDIPYVEIFMQGEGADFYLGTNATVSTTTYGAKVSVTGQQLGSGALGPFVFGRFRLSDFWAVGTGATVHIMAVPA